MHRLSVPSTEQAGAVTHGSPAEKLACPALIVQGERDPFGGKNEIASYKLAPTIRLHWASDGDHDLGPRGGSGFTRKGNLAAAADAIAAFLLKP